MPIGATYIPRPLAWRGNIAFAGEEQLATLTRAQNDNYQFCINGFPTSTPVGIRKDREGACQTVERSWERLWSNVAIPCTPAAELDDWKHGPDGQFPPERDLIVRAICAAFKLQVEHITWSHGWRIRSTPGHTVLLLWSQNAKLSSEAFEHSVIEAVLHLWRRFPRPRPRE